MLLQAALSAFHYHGQLPGQAPSFAVAAADVYAASSAPAQDGDDGDGCALCLALHALQSFTGALIAGGPAAPVGSGLRLRPSGSRPCRRRRRHRQPARAPPYAS